MDSTYSRNRFDEIEDQLSIIDAKISYLIRLLKQNGIWDYKQEAAYKANLAMAKKINAKWAKEMAEAMNTKLEEDIRKSQDNSKSK